MICSRLRRRKRVCYTEANNDAEIQGQGKQIFLVGLQDFFCKTIQRANFSGSFSESATRKEQNVLMRAFRKRHGYRRSHGPTSRFWFAKDCYAAKETVWELLSITLSKSMEILKFQLLTVKNKVKVTMSVN